MERLTKRERVGLIAFSIIIAAGIFISVLIRSFSVQEASCCEKNQTDITEFERRILAIESDTVSLKKEKKKSVEKSKTVYRDINPLEEKMERKQ